MSSIDGPAVVTRVALGFMIVSNIFTIVGYFVRERFWARIRWGLEPKGT
jgi:hypothetical protein